MMYKYKSKDWESGVDYSFSKYEGLRFLKNYFKTRKKDLEEVKIYLTKNFKKVDYERVNSGLMSKTNQKLIDIINIIENDNKIVSDLVFFVKKFELYKKVFDNYMPGAKKGQGSYKNIKNYIFLSLACLRAYNLSQNLKYLNTSLKLNDIISSKKSRDLEYVDLIKIKELFILEMSSIKDLMNNE